MMTCGARDDPALSLPLSFVTMIVSPLLVRSKTSDVLRVTSRTPIMTVVISRC